MTWRTGRMIGLPDMRPDSLAKAMTEPVKVMAPMATPSAISIRLAAWMAPRLADAEGLRRIERAGGDEHRGETDERVERRDQFRHHRHRDARAVTAPMRPPTPRPRRRSGPR